jgi:hypothetical protein
MLTRTLCLGLLCLAAGARAAAPVGPYSYQIGGDSEIWYADGEGSFCDNESGGSICVDTTTSTDGTGAITGTGTVAIHLSDSNGTIDGDLPMVMTGNLGGTAKAPKPKFTATVSGSLKFVGSGINATIPFSGSSRFTCKNPLPHGPEFACPGHLKLCGSFEGKRACFNGRFAMNVGAAGGAWKLDTNLSTGPDNTISGTGTATLANELGQDFVASGKYSPGSGVSKMQLKATDPLSKNKVTFAETFGMYSPTSTTTIKFKVAGVSGSYVLSLAPP